MAEKITINVDKILENAKSSVLVRSFAKKFHNFNHFERKHIETKSNFSQKIANFLYITWL